MIFYSGFTLIPLGKKVATVSMKKIVICIFSVCTVFVEYAILEYIHYNKGIKSHMDGDCSDRVLYPAPSPLVSRKKVQPGTIQSLP
jgi:hypothetical protein